MKGKKLITTICIVCVLAALLCIPAFATVTESNGDGYALYNGVKLPDIDSVWTDKTAYPYAFIQTTTNGGACLRLSSAIPYSDGTYIRGENINYSEYDFFVGRTDWEFYRTTTNYTGPFFAITQSLWASADVLNSDNSVYLAASSPIPLDGYNVIEWDGDTTGLFSDAFVGYKLAPYEFATDAFAVWNGGTRSIQTTYAVDTSLWAVQSVGGTGVSDGTAIVVGADSSVDGFSESGIFAMNTGIYYTSLIAYRSTETPPDEGGGDDDDPQPPAGG